MIIIKIIELGLNVQDCIGLYTDPDNIKQILIDRYEGQCYASCYITQINKIRKISECVINQDGNPTFGTISIVCEVTAIVYARGEIINGCVVQNRGEKGVIVASTNVASILISPHPLLESIVEKQIISVRVGAARYNRGATRISVNALPFLPKQVAPTYRVEPFNIKASSALFEDVLRRIGEEEAEVATLKTENGKAWDTFDQLLYVYREPRAAPVGSQVLDVRKIAAEGIKNKTYLCRDPCLNLSSPNVCSYSDSTLPLGSSAVSDLTGDSVILLLLEDYCAHLRTIREMIGLYNTEKLITDHRNLWQIFRKIKA